MTIDEEEEVVLDPEVFKKAMIKESVDINEAKLSKIEEEFKMELDQAHHGITNTSKRSYVPDTEFVPRRRSTFKSPDQEINELLAG